jgi:hypothetical protein
MVCLTIDSVLGKFCYNCGVSAYAEDYTGNLKESTVDGMSIMHCEECLEAKRLDDIDGAKLLKQGPPTAREWEAICQRYSMFKPENMLIEVRREEKP